MTTTPPCSAPNSRRRDELAVTQVASCHRCAAVTAAAAELAGAAAAAAAPREAAAGHMYSLQQSCAHQVHSSPHGLARHNVLCSWIVDIDTWFVMKSAVGRECVCRTFIIEIIQP
jgi:hypothetical protein